MPAAVDVETLVVVVAVAVGRRQPDLEGGTTGQATLTVGSAVVALEDSDDSAT